MYMGMNHGGNYGAIKWACVILSELLSLLFDRHWGSHPPPLLTKYP